MYYDYVCYKYLLVHLIPYMVYMHYSYLSCRFVFFFLVCAKWRLLLFFSFESYSTKHLTHAIDSAVALMNTFARQILQAEGSASFDERQRVLMEHMVAAQGASTNMGSYQQLSSGLTAIQETSSVGDDSNSSGGDPSSSRSSSSNVGLVVGLTLGVVAFAAIAAVVVMRQKGSLNAKYNKHADAKYGEKGENQPLDTV